MKTIINFLRSLIFEDKESMIGLAKFKKENNQPIRVNRQEKREYTLTDMLRRTY